MSTIGLLSWGKVLNSLFTDLLMFCGEKECRAKLRFGLSYCFDIINMNVDFVMKIQIKEYRATFWCWLDTIIKRVVHFLLNLSIYNFFFSSFLLCLLQVLLPLLASFLHILNPVTQPVIFVLFKIPLSQNAYSSWVHKSYLPYHCYEGLQVHHMPPPC